MMGSFFDWYLVLGLLGTVDMSAFIGSTLDDAGLLRLQYIDEATSLLEQQMESLEECVASEFLQLDKIKLYSEALAQQGAMIESLIQVPVKPQEKILSASSVVDDKGGMKLSGSTGSSCDKENHHMDTKAKNSIVIPQGMELHTPASSSASFLLVGSDELEAVSKSTRGRLSLQHVNDYIELLARMIDDKKKVLKSSFATASITVPSVGFEEG